MADSTLIARKLSRCRYAIAATPNYWNRHGRPSDPGDFADHACMLYDFLPEPGEWRFQGPDEAFSIRVTGPMKSNNGEALLEAAMAGLGVAMLPTFIAGEALHDGRLERVLGDFETSDVHAYAVWPQSRHGPYFRRFPDRAIRPRTLLG